MGCEQLAALSFMLACASLTSAQLLGAGVPAHRGFKVQGTAAEAEPTAEAERKHSSQLVGRLSRFQLMRPELAREPFSWKFPEDPVDPLPKHPAEYKVQKPVSSDRLAVRCGDNKIYVEVSQDLQGLGKLISPEELTLGGCSATEIDDETHVLAFESDLHSCNSTLVMTETAFIYAFVLIYKPKVLINNLIKRYDDAAIGVECHYLKKSSASVGPLNSLDKDIEEQPYFSLQLMSDDWKSERTSNKYSLGDLIKMEVSIKQSTQKPLKVLVDHCVAGLNPASLSEPKQVFVKNHGCLGGRHIGSRFMPQSQPERLQFEVEASSFHPLRLMFIFCYVKAIPASHPVTIEHKTCSFTQGWRAVSGENQFCACCASTCGMRKARALGAQQMEMKWDAELVVGPISIKLI